MEASLRDNRAMFIAEELCRERESYARLLRAQGKPIVGYFCCITPVEIITAAQLVPYRMTGNILVKTGKADSYAERALCGYLRSCFDLGLQGAYDFLDGLAVPHACNHVQIMDTLWKHYCGLERTFSLNVPHISTPASQLFFKSELGRFRRGIEKLAGKQIDEQDLSQAIRLHNEVRSLLRKLSYMRKPDPPLLSGVEMLKLAVLAASLPVPRANEVLGDVLRETAQSRGSSHAGVRLLVCGATIDNVDFIELVESCGAWVVADDLCFGTRSYRDDVIITDDPLDGLAEHYLRNIKCPRTYRETREARFGHIGEMAKEFGARGVIVYTLKFCDSWGTDIPDLRDYLNTLDMPLLHIEDDYFLSGAAGVRTRVQAFVEMLI